MNLKGSSGFALGAARVVRREKLALWKRVALVAGCGTLLLVILGRGPAALACNFQAEHALAEGNYADALTWLGRARWLNPELEQLASYHVEWGHAWYFLHPTEPNVDSRAYLGTFYLVQNDYLSSYQELQGTLQMYGSSPWLLDAFGTTLARIAEEPHPLHGEPTQRVTVEQPALTWLETLQQADGSNVYARYMMARLSYDRHDYSGCEAEMMAVLNLSQDHAIQSSAYTYLGLSAAGQGKVVAARDYLFQAQELDPEFRNNTAREEISGLR